MADKTEVKRIDWNELLSRIEKNSGIPKATVQESFKETQKEIENIIVNERIEGTTIIKTPIVSVVSQYFPKRIEKDEKGKEWEYSPCYGISAAAPTEWVGLANTGYECKRKAIG